MKVLSTLFLFILPFFSFNDTEKMQWNEHRQLTWADFQGTPTLGADYVASTNSGISFSFSYEVKRGTMSMDYEIKSNFYPKLSWYKPERVSEYILKHEQTHFDITELFARKLRKAMEEKHFSHNPKEEVNTIYKKIEKERRQMQNKYDKESDHSKNKMVELQWRKFVAKELKKYERWKS